LGRSAELREPRVSVEASELVSIPRAELDAMKAELKRLRREVGRGVAMARIQADPGPGDDAPAFTREQLAEAWGIGE
jgi:hypothetical protein